MPNHFEYCEFVGISSVGVEDAIRQALDAIAKTRAISWFEVVSIRGRMIEPAGTIEFQVTVKCGCKP